MASLWLFAALALAAVVARGAAQSNASGGGWQLGRATYYAAPEQVVRAYDPSRGTGSFGILAYGACGYTNLPTGTLPFPREEYAASADGNSDYPGSCGRCYELRCKSGLVLNNEYRPIKLVYPKLDNGSTSSIGYFDGDTSRPYLASINASVPDDMGRTYPGNPAEPQGEIFTQCHANAAPLRVRIADSCPCRQVLPEGAPGVKPGGEVRRQEWCCGPVQHFDISYWAFERLAHPVSGAMMLEWRPVDCDTGAPLPSANFISSTVYSSARGIQAGWGWHCYSCASAELLVPGTAPDGGLSTCVRVSPGGGLQFSAREAYRSGFQPFKGKSNLTLAMRSNANSTSPYDTSTPQGQNPGGAFKLFVWIEEKKQYCFNEVYFNSTSVPARPLSGGWFSWSVPLATFKCQGALDPNELNRFDLQNVAKRDAVVCVTDVALV